MFLRHFSKLSFILIISILTALLAGFYGCAQITTTSSVKSPPSISGQTKMEKEFHEAESLFQQGRYETSLLVYNDFRKHFPESPFEPIVLQRIGEVHFIRKDFRTAAVSLEQIVKKHPDFPRLAKVQLTLAYCYFYLQDPERSSQILKGISINQMKGGERGDFVYLQAQLALRMRDYPTALQKFVGLIPSPPGVLAEEDIRREIQDLIVTYLTLQHLKDLVGIYTKEYPGDLLRWQLVTKLKEKGQTEEARRVSAELMAFFPDSEWAARAKDMLAKLPAAPSKTPAPKRLSGNKSPLIGAILPLTGKYSNLGTSVLNGIELAYTASAWATTGELQLLIKDDQSSPQKAFEAFKELANNERVLAVVGPAYDESAKEIAALAENFRLPTFSPSAESLIFSKLEPYFFRNCFTNVKEGGSLAYYTDYILGVRSLAIMYPNNPVGVELTNSFSQIFKEKGGQIVISQHYPPETTDFTKIIADLTKKNLNFQALFLPDNYKAGVIIAGELAFHDLNTVQLIGTSLWDSPEFLNFGGSSVEGVIFSSEFYPYSQLPQVRSFLELYQSRFQRLPDALSAQSYDIAHILVHIIGQRGARSREEIKEKLLSTRNYLGPSRLSTITANGDGLQSLSILRVMSGKIMQLQ